MPSYPNPRPPIDYWTPVRQPSPGYSPQTGLPPTYPSRPSQTGEIPQVVSDDGLSPDWPPPSWPEYEASLAYSDDLDEPETKRRRKAPAVICLLLLVAGTGAAAYWFGQEDGVEVEGTSSGGEQRALIDDPSPEPDTGALDDSPEDDSSSGDESSEETAPADTAEPTDGTATETDTTQTDTTDDNPTDGGGGDPGGDTTGGGDSATGSPVDALEAMFTATNDSDCPALLDSLSADSRAMFGSDRNSQLSQCEQTLGVAPQDMAIQSASVTSETEQEATVNANYTENGTPTTEDFHIVREDSAWKVDLSTF